MNEARHDEAKHAPFDTARLDSLLENEGIDVLVATSKHNVQYLLGGYRFFFFDYMDAIGVSRYLPVVVYQKGRPDNTAYIGHPMESHEKESQVLASGLRDDRRQQHQRNSAGRRVYQGPARADRQDRRRGVLPALGRRQVATGRATQLPDCQRLFSAGAAARAKDESRAYASACCLRACLGLDARRVQRVCARPNEK